MGSRLAAAVRLSGKLVLVLLVAAGGPGCPGSSFANRHGVEGPARGSEAEQAFESLRRARQEAGTKPPSWVPRLEPIARDGAARLATGANGASVAHQVSEKVAYSMGRNVITWWYVVDDLSDIRWPPQVIGRPSLLVAIGVSLLQTTAPGRYAMILVVAESGLGFSPQ